ncbi:Hypothetical predicted protein [Paramuricea clavata]|uniref:Uncharacterized protein n=1 Tax=Paramuricea clavata TaxID=317549 RepID=A0A6S7IJH1_PARCT|nr:Hypothetical predicted protein [Paramuricea clavata]
MADKRVEWRKEGTAKQYDFTKVKKKNKKMIRKATRTIKDIATLTSSKPSSSRSFNDTESPGVNYVEVNDEHEVQSQIGNVQSMDVIVQGSVEVNDGHSYCMELVSQDGIRTLTVTCFLLQDYSINNTMLQESFQSAQIFGILNN